MRTLTLYRFRYRDPLSGKWIRSRHVEPVESITARFPEFELIEPPEIREVSDAWELTAGQVQTTWAEKAGA